MKWLRWICGDAEFRMHDPVAGDEHFDWYIEDGEGVVCEYIGEEWRKIKCVTWHDGVLRIEVASKEKDLSPLESAAAKVREAGFVPRTQLQVDALKELLSVLTKEGV